MPSLVHFWWGWRWRRTEEANEAHEVISNFVLSFLAPIYFVSMGMAANFAP